MFQKTGGRLRRCSVHANGREGSVSAKRTFHRKRSFLTGVSNSIESLYIHFFFLISIKPI